MEGEDAEVALTKTVEKAGEFLLKERLEKRGVGLINGNDLMGLERVEPLVLQLLKLSEEKKVVLEVMEFRAMF